MAFLVVDSNGEMAMPRVARPGDERSLWGDFTVHSCKPRRTKRDGSQVIANVGVVRRQGTREGGTRRRETEKLAGQQGSLTPALVVTQ